MKVLLVEDDLEIASFVVKGLSEAGLVTDHEIDGRDGLEMAVGENYDAIIVDIMLPGLDGLSLIRELRKKDTKVPVIILSAKRSVDDKVKGLMTGSDDYLTKPFAFAELLARIQAAIRRSSQTEDPVRLKTGNLSLNLATREVNRGDVAIDLQPREFALLEYLMRSEGRILTRTMILEHIWDYHFDPQTNVVDVLMCRLRNKVDRDFEEKLIHTMRGVGYVLKQSS
ncbi:MAG: response regulator transcription factor [Desulfatiglandaceae bacterium]|jgi:DNA-binding response OmpR family regulator